MPLETFLTAKTAAGLTPDTLRLYAQVLHRYCAAVPTSGPNAHSPAALASYLAQLRDRLKPSSVAAHYQVLHAYFGWLMKQGYSEVNPLAGVPRPRVPRQPHRHVTPTEYRRLFSSIPHDEGAIWLDHRDRALVVVLFTSGLRVMEACGMQTGDVDLAHHLLTVRRGKGGNARVVPCAPCLTEPLVSYLYTRPPWSGRALWVGSDGRHGMAGALGDEGVRMMLRRRCEAAGLRYMNPHAFRHGFAMAWLNAGMHMSAVSAVMGHSSQAVTEAVYAHWQTESLSREYAQALRRLNGGEDR